MRLKPPTNSILRQWGFEIYCIVMATAMLVVMIVVLRVFDSKPVFDGPIVTLNAIISTLSTTSRVSLLAMFASAIGQWNWLLFSKKSRRLIDFEHLAEASRGPLGSFKVLVNRHIVGGWVVRFGAMLTICTIALDPFAQQLVQIKEVTRPFDSIESRRAEINIAHGYSQVGASTTSAGQITVNGDELSGDVEAFIVPDYAMEVAVRGSFANLDLGVQLSPGVNCTYGECRWDPYETLAVCSSCNNITPSLRIRERTSTPMPYQFQAGKGRSEANETFNMTEYYLPNGLYLSNPNTERNTDEHENWLLNYKMHMTMYGTGDRNKTVVMRDVDTLIWAQSFIRAGKDFEKTDYRKWPGPEVSAYECELHYCVKEFSGNTAEGGMLTWPYRELDNYKRDPESWDLIDENASSGDRFPDWTHDYLAFHPVLSTQARTPLALGVPPNYEKRFTVEPMAVWGNSILMKNLLTECIDRNDNCTEQNQDASFGPPNGFLAGNYTYERKPALARNFYESTDLDDTFRKISEAMTVAIRNGADFKFRETTKTDDGLTAGVYEPVTATGKVWLPVAIYITAWSWIALHCTLTIGGAVFLALTIRYTSKSGLPAWKTSELAIFAQAGSLEPIFDGEEKQSELETKARGASVTLLAAKRYASNEESGESLSSGEDEQHRVSTSSRSGSESGRG